MFKHGIGQILQQYSFWMSLNTWFCAWTLDSFTVICPVNISLIIYECTKSDTVYLFMKNTTVIWSMMTVETSPSRLYFLTYFEKLYIEIFLSPFWTQRKITPIFNCPPLDHKYIVINFSILLIRTVTTDKYI